MSIRRITPSDAPAVPNPMRGAAGRRPNQISRPLDGTANLVGLDAHRLHATDHVEIVHIALAPGQSLVRHASPVDTAFYIIEGDGAIESGSETAPVRAGELIPHPARTMHRMINNTAAPLRFLVIKTPKPTEPPEFE